MIMPHNNVIQLCQKLVQIESTSPDNGTCLQEIANFLQRLGFNYEIKEFHQQNSNYPVKNLYAWIGQGSNNLCFLGHSDVVPTGNQELWQAPPFSGQVIDDKIYGRGVVDMKGAIAAFLTATSDNINDLNLKQRKLSLLITADEEADAINGTDPMINYLIHEKNEQFAGFIVGEPTSKEYIGDTIKVGRRGSMNFFIQIKGKQGHVAYPNQACNPLPTTLTILQELNEAKLDDGDEYFSPSNLEITSIDVGNGATNVIPEVVQAKFNIRFNTNYSDKSLYEWVIQLCNKHCHTNNTGFELKYTCTAHPFISKSPEFSNKIRNIVQKITNKPVKLDTGGGTSDARFVHKYAPVAEIGLFNATAHQIDEHAHINDLVVLTDIYGEIIKQIV